jgi:hypothetical protein
MNKELKLRVHLRLERDCKVLPNGCWILLDKKGRRKKNPQLSTGDGIIPFHRAVYLVFNGEIEGKLVLHSCIEQSCCNPAHLYLGNHKDKMKQRRASGKYETVKSEVELEEKIEKWR